MYQTGCNAYRQSAGNMLEDSRVVLLKLYDGALKFLAQARRGIMEGSPKIRGENISKVMAIIEELNCALDLEKGGELASQLDSLYKYAIDRLTIATMQNDLNALDQAESVLSTLKEGFENAVQQQQKSVPITGEIIEETVELKKGVQFAI